ncbi:MAG: T9SS type A sorting domain-containing protein [Bacteroidia bacterium]
MSQKTLQKLFSLYILLSCFNPLLAQDEEISALKRNPTIIDYLENEREPVYANKKKQVLKLPFFDDFSTTRVYPSKNRWTNRSVFVNSSFAIQPPSHGVATFDGLNKNGYPYNIDGNNNPKPCDTLTSLPLDLSTLSAGDSVYLSFYLQQKGVGENPETNDSFMVEFKKDNNDWLRVWAKNADFDSFSIYPFRTYFIKVNALNDGSFFHDSFQFRFRNYGNRTGALDHWHLDYVYLDQNRTLGDTILEDVGIYRQPKGLFKNYYSMPWRHYREDRSLYRNSEIEYNVYNKATNQQSPDVYYVINDLTNNRGIDSTRELRQQITDVPAFGRKSAAQSNLLPFAYFDTLSNQNIKLQLKLSVSSNSVNEPIELLSDNDEYIMHQYFDNYLAYDDGSAEGGYGLKNTRQGSVALKFSLSRSDTLKYIAFNFTGGNEVLPDQQKFNIIVWSRLFPEPIEIARISSVKPVYTDLNNGFALYELTEPVFVSTQFYVGWEQFSVFNLNVGVDLDYRYFNDNQPNPNLYFNAAGQWENSKIVGTPLIRPVFGSDATLSRNDVWVENEMTIYPNPAKDFILLEFNEANSGQLSIVNLQGQEVYRNMVNEKKVQIDLRAYQSGMYLIRFENESGDQMVKRFVKE